MGQSAELSKRTFRNRTRSARNAVREIQQLSRQEKEKVRSTYRHLVQTARATVRQAEQVLTVLQEQEVKAAEKLVQTLRTFLPRLQQVLAQTVRRIFANELVPAEEKLVNIFEPLSDIIRRGKPRKPAEFGHKVWLGEVEGRFIAHYSVLDGNPADKKQWSPSLERHMEQFGHPPWQASGDRGVHSSGNEAVAEAFDVKRIVLPKPGRKSIRRREHEKQRWFRRG